MEEKIKVIRVKLKDDEYITKINASFVEIAQHYFSWQEVKEIEVLEGGSIDEGLYKTIVTRLYLAPEEDIAEWNLIYNVRYDFWIEFGPELQSKGYQNHATSAGLCNVHVVTAKERRKMYG